MKPITRTLGWASLRLALFVAGLAMLYVLVAFGFALSVPKQPPRQGDPGLIAVAVCDNGVHADIVVPALAAGIDWRSLFADALSEPIAAERDHVAFGWGSREFYAQTPRWRDVRPLLAARAVFWDRTALHVEFRQPPRQGDDCRKWHATGDEYHALSRFILSSIEMPDGRPVAIAQGYGATDAFFAATGRYTLIGTCNQWSGQALKSMGAPVALWTPFSFLVGWNLPDNS